MLTRIEIDGFKTFRGFGLDIPPFLVILGRNASGKSNLFDAIQFLRLLSEGTVLEAAQQMRGDVAELFHHHVDGTRMSGMRFAVEVALPPMVTDPFGDEATIRHTRVRYELAIELRATTRGERPYVAAESASLIRQSNDRWLRRFPVRQRPALAAYSGRRGEPLETRREGGRIFFNLRQEGRQGRPRQLPAAEATATVLSSLATAQEFPLLYALKRELQSWRLLQLDPVALRAPSSFDDPDQLATNGACLANVLRRIADDTASQHRPEGVLADLVADLSGVIPGVRDVNISEDDVRRQRYVQVRMRNEAPFSARVASDGTLRAIALLAALYDPRDSGLICFEEPENGLFPRRLADFLGHLRRRIDETYRDRSSADVAPLPQLLFSSHSPTVLRALSPLRSRRLRDDVVFIDTVSRIVPGEPRSRISRVRWIDVVAEVPETYSEAIDEEGVEDVEVGELLSDAELADGLSAVLDRVGAADDHLGVVPSPVRPRAVGVGEAVLVRQLPGGDGLAGAVQDGRVGGQRDHRAPDERRGLRLAEVRILRDRVAPGGLGDTEPVEHGLGAQEPRRDRQGGHPVRA